MLNLLVMRHCHSDAGLSARLSDRTRELSRQGAAAALEVGQALFDRKIVPRLILTSHATRTEQTAAIVAEAAAPATEISSIRALYHGSAENYLETINELGGDYSTLLIIGHNPSVSTFFGSCRAKGLNTGFFKAGELAILQMDLADWSQLRFHLGDCSDIISPLA